MAVNTRYVDEDYNELNLQTGTTYTLVAADNGKVVRLTNASAITVTMPNNMPVGFNCMLVQYGAGQVTMVPASGAVLRSRQAHSKIAGQYGAASLIVVANPSGTTAEWLLQGDTSA
jgi:hypothetical protein